MVLVLFQIENDVIDEWFSGVPHYSIWKFTALLKDLSWLVCNINSTELRVIQICRVSYFIFFSSIKQSSSYQVACRKNQIA